MNLSVLERMVRDGDLSRDACCYLLNCGGECEWLDYKESLQIENDKSLCDFGRDVLAMKNVGGGYIVVGVEDKTWSQKGLREPLPYDTKMLRDKIRKCTGLELEIDVVHHEIELGRLFAVLLIRSSRKRNKRRSPTLALHDFCVRQNYGIHRGDIFIRRGDSTIKVSSQSELEDLLDSLEAQADEDAVRGGTRSPHRLPLKSACIAYWNPALKSSSDVINFGTTYCILSRKTLGFGSSMSMDLAE